MKFFIQMFPKLRLKSSFQGKIITLILIWLTGLSYLLCYAQFKN